MAAESSTDISPIRFVVYASLAVTLGIVVAVALGEIVLRLTGWVAPGPYDNHGMRIDVYEPGSLGGSYPPGHNRLRHPDFDVRWVINQDGFRERAPGPKSPGARRVGLFGDSIAEGYGVVRRDRFGDVWFRAIQRDCPGLELWNFGAAGAGTAHVSEIVERFAEEYALDEVVLALFGGNELDDNNAWYRWKSLDGSQDAGKRRLLRNRRTLTAQPSDASPRRRSDLRIWLRRNSRLALFLWTRLAALNATPSGLSSADDIPMWYVEGSWPNTEKALERFLDAAGDLPVTLLYLPARMEWDDAVWETIRAREKNVNGDASRHRIRDRVVQWADRRGVRLVDATPWLIHRDAAEVKFPVDGHYSAAGHRLIADGLTRAFRLSGCDRSEGSR